MGHRTIPIKYLFISLFLLVLFTVVPSGAQAFSVEYGTVLSVKNPNVIIEYSAVGKKANYSCSLASLSCKATKKYSLGSVSSQDVPTPLRQELESKNADHLTLSPSGNYLAYYIAGTDATPTRQYVVRDMKTGAEYSVSTSISYWDLVDDQKKVFDFSPDEKSLVYLNDKDGSLALYIADTASLSGGSIASTKLATTAAEIDGFIFSDNNILFYIGNSKDNPYIWSLHKYDIATSSDTIVETNVSYVDPIIKLGNALVFNRLEKNGYGPEIYNLKTKKISQFKVPGVATARSISHQEVVQSAGVTGVLMTPTQKNQNDTAKTYPLVIWLHGGPYRQASYGWQPYHSYGLYDGILELLRKNNVIVLKLDYPGSLGLGTPFAESIKGGVGKVEVQNVMDAIAYVKNIYHINNVYLAGNSYGGYLALRTVVEHPEALAGVISINGVTDWQSLLEKMKTSIFNTEFAGLPAIDNQALYDQASISNKINNLGNQKIDIIAGEADRTIPYWQATDLYAQLKSANKNVSLISYSGEDHVYAKKSTITNLCTRIFDFLGKKVDPGCKS